MTEQEPKNLVEQRGPFKVTYREVKHDRFGMQLIGDKVIRPDGSEGEQFWVNFPREAVLIFPMDEEGNIYLAEEFNYATNQYSNEVAGGLAEEGENPRDAATRELKEELGIEVESIGYFGTLNEVTNRVKNTTHLFLAKVKSIGEANLEPGEVIRLNKVPFEQAYQMVLSGEISTSTVAAGILRIKDFLDKLKQSPEQRSLR